MASGDLARAVIASDLTPSERLVMLVLLTHAPDGVSVERKHAPSITTLAQETSLGRSTVARCLNGLELGGWIKRDVSAGTPTAYLLAVGSPRAGLVDQSQSGTSPRAGLPTSPTAGRVPSQSGTGSHLEVVPQRDQSGDLGGGRGGFSNVTGRRDKEETPPKGGVKGGERTIKPEPGSDDDPDFTEFWKIYPRKVAKGHARKAWRSALRRHAAPADIIAAAIRYRDDPNRGRDMQYTAHPATWLNGERYNDVRSSNGLAPLSERCFEF